MPQVCLTLESKLFNIATAEDRSGWLVPWEVAGYSEDFKASEAGGFFDLTDWGVLSLTGPDAADFLSRMSTLGFKAPHAPTRLGAFLTGKSGLLVLGYFQSVEGGFHIIVPRALTDAARSHIEQFHFAEAMQLRDVSAEWAIFAVKAAQPRVRYPVESPTWKDAYQADLEYVKVPRSAAKEFLKQCAQEGLPLLGTHLFEYFRVRSGLPQVGSEVDSTVMVLEADLERAVERNKGCYPGQEVVERIFTYGQVNRKLLRVSVEGTLPAVPIDLTVDEKRVGKLVAAVSDPAEPSRYAGLAFIQSKFWTSKQALRASEGVTVHIV